MLPTSTYFNPDTIKDNSTYAQPHQVASGVEHVFVNGVWTIKNGEHTGALAGVTLGNAYLNR
jgi:N-acyl-D-aspartate/D-glutamate deacylase